MSDGDGGAPNLARPGGFTYIQIPTTDAEASADFYERVFGWTIRQRGTSHVTFADGSGHVIGAFITAYAISRDPGVLPYVYVNSVGDAVKAIREHGGEIVREPYAEGALTVSTFRDVAGNVLGVWQMPG
jgi:predicted enzyme related to lactoylglutathione lyase